MNEIELIAEITPVPPEVKAFVPFIRETLNKLDIDDWQMGLLITDNEGIRSYNRQYRGIDRATDVLSFVQQDGEAIPQMPGEPREVGDIIVSLERVAENAVEWGRSYDEEIRRVLIHGLLHLKGLDHPGDDYNGEMLTLQEDLLAQSAGILDDDS